MKALHHLIFIAWICLSPVVATSARAGSVTLADLDGAVIETSVVYDRTGRWGNRVVSGTLRDDRKIAVGPGESLQNTIVHTMSGPSGTSVRQESGSYAINKPRQTQSLGGGEAVWVFENGTLTLLRTYRSGGYKTEIVFTRGATGIVCKVRAPFARENGTGSIEMTSAVNGQSWQVISARQISSSCCVTKR
jgi:hypothetical protein